MVIAMTLLNICSGGRVTQKILHPNQTYKYKITYQQNQLVKWEKGEKERSILKCMIMEA
jgi:hypothetical protein